MGKINPKKKIYSNSKYFVDERLAGGAGMYAAKQSNIMQLRRITLANLLWENNAYVDGKTIASQIQELVPMCDVDDLKALVLELRNVQKLRHTPLFVLREMTRYAHMLTTVRELLPQVISRADMLTDFVALYWTDDDGEITKTPIASCVKRGLADAFHNFNEYNFAKYNRDDAISLRDVMFMCHPKPKDRNEEQLFNKIANNILDTPDTWEVALAAGEDKKQTFERLITERKIGGLAFVRNLNNMMKCNVDSNIINMGFDTISTKMLLPINYIAANQMTGGVFSRQLEHTMLKNLRALPKLAGRTLLIIDKSGSMAADISSRSSLSRQDAANALAILAVNTCEQIDVVVTAGDDMLRKHKSVRIEYPSCGFDLINQITNTDIGYGGIYTRQVLKWSYDNVGKQYDRIIVFSDSQDCDRTNKVPRPYGKYNYICDVSAHKHGINYEGIWTAEISGWSENFLTYIAAYEGLTEWQQEEN